MISLALALLLASVDAPGPAQALTQQTQQAQTLDFDLLGAPPASTNAAPPAAVSEALIQRRMMLTAHQAVGIGLVGVTAGAMISGQLNYHDKFGGGNTNQYKSAHTVFATTSLVMFGGAGLLAFFAPVPVEKTGGVDRVVVHEVAIIGATVGMAAQAGLGIYTASREGFTNQSRMAGVHLAIGYATLALMTVAVGALVF